MSDLEALQQRREKRWFDGWEGMVPEGRTEKAEACIRQLIDDLIALGPRPRKRDVRKAVERCVIRFNIMDNEAERHWIMSTEREDIYYVANEIVDLTGVECDDFDDWFGESDW